MNLPQTARTVALDISRRFQRDDVLGLSAELSFRWLLAIFPLAIMTAAIAGFTADAIGVEDPTQEIIDAAGSELPPAAAETLRPQLDRVLTNRDGGLLSLGLVLTVYAASAGMRALIKGFNRAYGIAETRPFWRQIAVALALTLLAGTSVVVSFIIMVVGGVAAQDVAASLGLEDEVAGAIGMLRFPVVILAVGVASGFLYWAAPARHPPLRWVVPGVLLFVPGWIVATWLFSLYVASFGSYANTYGALAGVIVLLLWFYLTFLVLLLGAQLNAAFERAAGRWSRVHEVEPPGDQPSADRGSAQRGESGGVASGSVGEDA
ncbi:MAG: YihY/virulence factor BrkB family protein [Candidatus Limnocylindrales bacterium]